jgi:hypothetical protein
LPPDVATARARPRSALLCASRSSSRDKQTIAPFLRHRRLTSVD